MIHLGVENRLANRLKNISSGLHTNVQVTRKRFALGPCYCWRSSLGPEIQSETFAITLHF